MKEVLITGSNGSIGKVLSERLDKNWRIRPFDLPERDVRSYTTLRENMVGCAAVIHLAWDFMHDYFKFGQPSETTDPANYGMAQNVFRAAKSSGVGRVIIASSIHADMPRIEPGYPRSPYRPPEPDSPYGVSKVAIETMGRYYATHGGLEVVCIRFGWVGEEQPRFGWISPTQQGPYPPGEAWTSHADCANVTQVCLDSPTIPDNYLVLYGLSRREGNSAHDLSNPLGWTPQKSYTV